MKNLKTDVFFQAQRRLEALLQEVAHDAFAEQEAVQGSDLQGLPGRRYLGGES